MADLKKALFPHLDGKWVEVKLNNEAVAVSKSLAGCFLNILDPAIQERLINTLHKRLKVDYSYGGYLENRYEMYKKFPSSGLSPDQFWHLGVDFHVPANTSVCMPVDGELIYSANTNDANGGKLVFQVADVYLVFGHLGEMVEEKRLYRKGEEVGRVGTYPENGNWFPHLHVQCCRKYDINTKGHSHDYEGIEQDFPHPDILLNGDYDVVQSRKCSSGSQYCSEAGEMS